MLAPHDGAAVYSIRFPVVFLRLLPLLFLGCIAGILWTVTDHLETKRTARQVQELLAQNRALLSRLDEMEEMEKDLRDLERFGGRIRTFAGLAPSLEETEEPPQGGPLSDDLEWESDMGDRDQELLFLPVEEQGDIQQRLLSQRVIFEEIFAFVVDQKETLAKTPAIWPVSRKGGRDVWISSLYGRRRSPFSGAWEFHGGLDIVAPRGALIHATADGKVEFSGTKPGLGRTVVLRHGENFESWYGHCDKLLVREGEIVYRGDSIATVGNTGRSTGVHVHYEVRRNGKTVNPLDFILD